MLAAAIFQEARRLRSARRCIFILGQGKCHFYCVKQARSHSDAEKGRHSGTAVQKCSLQRQLRYFLMFQIMSRGEA